MKNLAKCKSKYPDPKQAQMNYVYNFYRYSAVKRNLSFELSPEQFFSLTQNVCHYCGTPPSNISSPKKDRRCGESFVYSGIDRIESAEGYSMSNCVPCCRICNVAKSNMNYYDFLAWAKRLNNHREKFYQNILGV